MTCANGTEYHVALDAGTSAVDTGAGSTQAMTVYGRVPAGRETTAPGHYSDIVTVTITY